MEKNINEKWEVLSKTMKEFDELYHKIATHYNLSDTSFWILYDLYQHKEGYTQKELCSNCYVSKQTINSSIKYLKEKGYIELKYEGNNRKFKKVCITDKGLNIAKQSVVQVIEMEKKVCEETNEDEMNIAINFFKNQITLLKKEMEKILKED